MGKGREHQIFGRCRSGKGVTRGWVIVKGAESRQDRSRKPRAIFFSTTGNPQVICAYSKPCSLACHRTQAIGVTLPIKTLSAWPTKGSKPDQRGAGPGRIDRSKDASRAFIGTSKGFADRRPSLGIPCGCLGRQPLGCQAGRVAGANSSSRDERLRRSDQ